MDDGKGSSSSTTADDWLNKSNNSNNNNTARSGFGRVFAKIFGGGEEDDDKPAAKTEYPGSLRNMLRGDDEEKVVEEEEAKLSSVATLAAARAPRRTTIHHQHAGEFDDRTAADGTAGETTAEATAFNRKSAPPTDEIGVLAEALLGLKEPSPTAATAVATTATSPPSPKRRKVTSLAEYISHSQIQIQRAGTLVARTLQTGPWPSPYRSLHPRAIAGRSTNNNTSSDQSHAMHVSMVGASLEKFTHDILQPTLTEALHHTPKVLRHTHEEQRIFLGTLLLLREALILNAATIFGDSALLTGKESDFGSSLASLDAEEEDARAVALFSVKVLATTVVLTALEELDNNNSNSEELLSDRFLELVEEYDLGDQALVSCLRRVTAHDTPHFPNHQPMGENEQRSWRISYNAQLAQHPLVQRDPSVVQSTAVHVSILQPNHDVPAPPHARNGIVTTTTAQ